MGKSTINGNFQQLNVKLPEGIPVIHYSSIIVGDWSIINYYQPVLTITIPYFPIYYHVKSMSNNCKQSFSTIINFQFNYSFSLFSHITREDNGIVTTITRTIPERIIIITIIITIILLLYYYYHYYYYLFLLLLFVIIIIVISIIIINY